MANIVKVLNTKPEKLAVRPKFFPQHGVEFRKEFSKELEEELRSNFNREGKMKLKQAGTTGTYSAWTINTGVIPVSTMKLIRRSKI